jgi:hypothetical protein
MSRLLEIVVWWALALGVWLLTLAYVDWPDLVVAVPLALACGVMAAAARRSLAASWQPQRAALRWLRHLPAAVVTDTAIVLSLPWRRLAGRLPDEGRFERVAVSPGPDAAAASRRTAAAVLLSSTPGAYAVHADSDTGELLVHEMGSGPCSMSEAVKR